jgi:hypothetical protein
MPSWSTGNLIQFAQSVVNKVQALDNLSSFPMHTETIRSLSDLFSPKQELSDMQSFIKAMGLPF